MDHVQLLRQVFLYIHTRSATKAVLSQDRSNIWLSSREDKGAFEAPFRGKNSFPIPVQAGPESYHSLPLLCRKKIAEMLLLKHLSSYSYNLAFFQSHF